MKLRMRCYLTFATFAASTCLAQRTAEKAEDPPGKPYVYTNSGGKDRHLEIYFPPGHDPAKSRAPGLILFHGGGWSGGTPAQFRAACAYFASRGMVTATAEYRMLTKDEAAKLPKGESRKRVCVEDARSAIRWFKSHAGELGIDPSKIVTGGGSAGGHVSVLATTNPGTADAKGPDTSVVAYLLFNPAFTPDDAADPEIDAISHARPGFPPAIVFFGTDDHWKSGWDALLHKHESLGNTKIQVLLSEGQPHGFFNREPWRTLTLIEADRFLAAQGLISGEPAKRTPEGDKRLKAERKPGAASSKE